MGFGFAVRDGCRAGHGALTEVRQMLPWNLFVSEPDRFLISTPALGLWSTETCTAGFPATRLRRMMFLSIPATNTIPFVFPTIVLSSITLSLLPGATIPIPKLFPWAVKPFPLVRFARSRLRLAPPVSHIPPHGLLRFPFRTETLFSTRFSDPPLTKIPERQFVDTVTPVTVTPVLPRIRMPSNRNRWIKPGPLMTTSFCALTSIAGCVSPVYLDAIAAALVGETGTITCA